MKEWTADNFHTGNVNGDHCFTGVNLLTWEFIENSCWRLNGDVTFVAVSVSCAGFWTTEAVSVEGVLGGDVTIKCSHSNACRNVKYFCKDPCKDEDVLITSRQISRGRYSISKWRKHVLRDHLSSDRGRRRNLLVWNRESWFGHVQRSRPHSRKGWVESSLYRNCFYDVVIRHHFITLTFIPFHFHQNVIDISQKRLFQTDLLFFTINYRWSIYYRCNTSCIYYNCHTWRFWYVEKCGYFQIWIFPNLNFWKSTQLTYGLETTVHTKQKTGG